MTLDGQRILILGGASGIGLAVAKAASAEGAQVLIASRNPQGVAAALDTLPPGAQGRVLDLSDPAAVTAFFQTVEPFDHLVFTAGEGLSLGSLAETDIDKVRGFFELRYWGAFRAVQQGAPLIRKGGSIVLTSGLASTKPHPGWAVASSICSAMEGLTRALAVELAPLRVNIVCPGVVKTPLWRDMAPEAREALYASQASRLPVGHVAEAEEIAEGYLYLMRQTFATGQTLVLDGGGLLV